MSRLHVVRIEDIVQEVHHTKTFRFTAPFDALPGQFIMVWVPRHDEIPMALSYLDELKGFTSHAQGDTTNALAKFNVGDRIGIRGPLGNGFNITGHRILFVAGGTGMASLIAAIETSKEGERKVVTVLGAKTKKELIFEKRAKDVGDVHISTDDGTAGFHGTSATLAEKLIDEDSYDQVITCGPELMMKRVVDVALEREIFVQASLERYMKCAIGICDSCAIGDRLVCVDGPVFDGEFLSKCEDFGRYRRDQCGRKTPIQ